MNHPKLLILIAIQLTGFPLSCVQMGNLYSHHDYDYSYMYCAKLVSV